MNVTSLLTHTFMSLVMCVMVLIAVYILRIAHIPHLYTAETAVPNGIILKLHDLDDKAKSLPNLHPHQQEKLIRTLKVKKAFLSQYALSSNKLKVPPLPNTLPYAAYLKGVDEIQQAPWTTQLFEFLKNLDQSISPHVNMVFADSHHLDLVLNWIIAAHLRLDPPLHNIMVLSVDQPLCDFLASKKLQVTCIAVPSESILASTGNGSYEEHIKTRFVVLRVINFWGYDVASYDSDAIILRNPQHLYDSNPDVQVFGGSSHFPRLFADIWGFAVCGGTLIVRSHPSTEILWEYIHNSTTDDCEQCLWNIAMVDFGIGWNVTTDREKLCDLQSGWQSNGPLASIVFPQTMLCRRCCRRTLLHQYYVVHPNNEHLDILLKHQRLKGLRSWFLTDSWKDLISSPLKGNLWLLSIYNR